MHRINREHHDHHCLQANDKVGDLLRVIVFRLSVSILSWLIPGKEESCYHAIGDRRQSEREQKLSRHQLQPVCLGLFHARVGTVHDTLA